MKNLPDLREEAHSMLEECKKVLTENKSLPLHAIVTLTPTAQKRFEPQFGEGQDQIVLDLRLTGKGDPQEEKLEIINQAVNFIRRFGEFVIFRGIGLGLFPELSPTEVKYVFVCIMLPGYAPWTIAQVFQEVNGEYLWLNEVNSVESNIGMFVFPEIWPEAPDVPN